MLRISDLGPTDFAHEFLDVVNLSDQVVQFRVRVAHSVEHLSFGTSSWPPWLRAYLFRSLGHFPEAS